MIIKMASIKDLGEIKELNQELFNHDFKFDKTLNVKWPSKNKKYYLASIKSKNSIVLVVKIEDKTAGYLIGSITSPESYRKIKKIAELDNMLVRKEYRGQGIGTSLIKEFLKWAKSKKMERVRVIASAENKLAINTYSKNGFRAYNQVMEMKI